MDSNNQKHAWDPDLVDEVGIPLSWLATTHSASPTRTSSPGAMPASSHAHGRAPPSSYEVLFDEEWPPFLDPSPQRAPARVRVPPSPALHRNAIFPPSPRESLPRFAADFEPYAPSVRVAWGEVPRTPDAVDMQEVMSSPPDLPASEPNDGILPVPLRAGMVAQGDSVAPVAMTSGLPLDDPDPFAQRRNKVHSIAYTAMVGVLCLVAVGVYRWEPNRSSPSSSAVAAALVPAAEEPAVPVIRAAWVHAFPVVQTAEPPVAIGSPQAPVEAIPAFTDNDRTIEQAEVRVHGTVSHVEGVRGNPKPGQPPRGPTAQATVAPAPEPSSTLLAPDAPELGPLDPAQVTAAMNTAAASASDCLSTGQPSAMVRLHVVFAPNGAVTTAWVDGPPYGGTLVGGCIAQAFRAAKVEPFSGPRVTVHRSFQIPVNR